MSQDPRAQVRDMIADKLSGQLDLQRWAVEGWPTIAEDLADEVMGLFPEVWQHHAASGPCYVLRTTPTGQTCRHCADTAALADMRREVIALHREEITAAGRVIDAARALDRALRGLTLPGEVMDVIDPLAEALAAFDEARAGSPGSPRRAQEDDSRSAGQQLIDELVAANVALRQRRAQVAGPVDVLPAPKLAAGVVVEWAGYKEAQEEAARIAEEANHAD